MAEDQETKTFHFSCFCKDVTGSFTVPTSRLPLPVTLCHCDTCRYQSGQLATSYCCIPEEHVSSVQVQGPVSIYEASKKLTRCFCPTCGANVYIKLTGNDVTDICTSALDNTEPTDLKITDQIFLSDCKDGGMSPWLPHIKGWEASSNESKEIDCATYLRPIPPPDTETKYLECHCACRAISFRLTRPSQASRDSVSGPYADVLKPYVSTPASEIENGEDDKWWLRKNDTRFLASHCVCVSCRKCSGFDIQSWAFVPKLNILHSDPDEGEFLASPPEKLKTFDSSPGRHRDFCAGCGATVFYRSDKRPTLIDVSAGLMVAGEGVRAEGWLDWYCERVSFGDDARDGGVIGKFVEGLKGWEKVRGEVEVRGGE